ncbi:MAG: hypothetical protein AAGB12_12630 [Pseudomonadota bacterium]
MQNRQIVFAVLVGMVCTCIGGWGMIAGLVNAGLLTTGLILLSMTAVALFANPAHKKSISHIPGSSQNSNNPQEQ